MGFTVNLWQISYTCHQRIAHQRYNSHKYSPQLFFFTNTVTLPAINFWETIQDQIKVERDLKCLFHAEFHDFTSMVHDAILPNQLRYDQTFHF